MSIRIAQRGEVSHHATDISWRLNQNMLRACEFSNSIDFIAGAALKSEVIEPGFHFILHDDQHEDRIFTRIGLRSQPDVVPSLKPSIANDGQAAE